MIIECVLILLIFIVLFCYRKLCNNEESFLMLDKYLRYWPGDRFSIGKDYFVDFLKLKPQGRIVERFIDTINDNTVADNGVYEFTLIKNGKAEEVMARYSFILFANSNRIFNIFPLLRNTTDFRQLGQLRLQESSIASLIVFILGSLFG